MAYATVQELADALRVRLTPENTPGMQACLDAAAVEINSTVDAPTESNPLVELPPDPLLNRVNILRGVEWFKSNDAAFGVVGFDQAGTLQAPRDGFARHQYTLRPLKRQWGVA